MFGISNQSSSAEVPENETHRLAAIEKYRILDTENEKDFDNLVELAAQICNTPISIITLIDIDRQWFKARRGWPFQETARNLSFCAHTILQNEVMVVPDAAADLRFKSNPLVTGEPKVRFYAGMPLITSDGYKIGTLAVLDRCPRTLSEQQLFSLRTLARQVINMLDLRYKNLKLHESNVKNTYLANLLEHTHDAIFSTDRDGTVISWNKGAENIFGIEKSKALGHSSTSIIDSPFTQEERMAIRKAVKAHACCRVEKPLRDRNGTLCFIQYTINAIEDELGEPEGYVIVAKDITEKQKLEEELRQNNTVLQKRVEEKTLEIRNVFERVSDGFVAIDENGICTYANKKAEQLVNCPEGFLIGKYIWNEFHESVEQAFKPLIQKAMTTQERQSMEVYYPLYERWFDNYIYPSPTGISVYFRDITRRKNAELNIKHNDEIRRLIMNSSLDAIIGMDKNGFVSEWNVQAEKIFGWKRDEVMNKRLVGVISPERPNTGQQESLTSYLKPGEAGTLGSLMETTALHRSGKEFPIELTIVPIKQHNVDHCVFIRDITERKTAEQKIRESEERYREIVETAHEGIWMIDENANTTFVNDHMANLLGYDKSEMLGKHLFHFMDEENRIVAEYNLARRKIGIREQHDFTFLTKDKRRIITSLKANPVLTNGVYKGALAMVMDVTHRRRMEEKVILSERRFRALIENSTDGLTVVDTNGVVLDISPSAHKILGLDPEEIIGTSRPDLIHPDDRACVRAAFARTLAAPGAVEKLEYRHVMPDGSHKWLECAFNNLTDEPSVNAVVLNYRDITERKRSEDEILKINERFKLVTHATNDVVWDWNLKMETVWWNENYFSLFEYDKEKVRPDINSWYDGIHPDDHERVVRSVHKVIQEKLYYWSEEYRFAKSDGTYLDIYDRGYVIYDHDNQPVRMIGAMTDITKRKAAEDKLKAQFEELQKKNYELDQFVYSVSHDLRAPLASVLGLINIAEMDNLTPTLKEYLNLMRCSIDRLDDFIHEILDYSRNSRMEVRIEKIDFYRVIQEIHDRLNMLKEAERIEFKINIRDDIDFYSDNRRLQVILDHLMENAVLYQDTQKENVLVQVDIVNSVKHATIEITDNGVGIDSRFIDNIFKMFYRASSNSTGSGLGLYIVKETINRLGGTISVASVTRQFTTFKLIIPNGYSAVNRAMPDL